MKVLKRFFVLFMAFALACVAFVFVACGDGTHGEGTGGNTEENESDSGNGNSDGDKENDEIVDLEKIPVAASHYVEGKSSCSEKYISRAIYEFTDSIADSFKMENLIRIEYFTDSLDSSPSGETDMFFNVKGDNAANIYDVWWLGKANYGKMEYDFFRNDKMYNCITDDEITDLSEVEVSFYESGDNMGFENYLPALFDIGYPFLKLGNFADAVKKNGNTVNVDINKTLYKTATALMRTVDELKENMTIKQFMENKVIKSVLSSILGGFPPESLAGVVELFYGELLKGVTPDENSTAFDYLLKLLASEDLYTLLREQNNGVFPDNVTSCNDLKLGFIAETFLYELIEYSVEYMLYYNYGNKAGEMAENYKVTDFSTFKIAVKMLFEVVFNDATETNFKFLTFDNQHGIHSYSSFELENATCTFVLDNDKIVNQNFTADIKKTEEYDTNSYDLESGQIKRLVERHLFDYAVSMELNYPSEKPVFANLKIL